jgi:TRAP transporter 4TM/12TM fusion protein
MTLALPARYGRWFIGVIAIVLTLVEFLPLILRRSVYELTFLATHVGATVAISFLIFGPAARRDRDASIPVLDVLLATLAVICSAYFAMQGARVAERIEGVDAVYSLDVVFGLLLLVLLLESCRRATSVVLAILAAIFILYIFLGPYLPDTAAHRGMSLERFIDLQVLSTQAIFGTPISASAHMVFYFIVVGAFLERSGAGRLFVDLAYSITGRAWGGAGKASVISSGLFGTVSGSAVANVLVDGIVTIPLMKRTGFSAKMASAIEATASTGGQLAPPVMGAAAFILADIVGIPYADVAYAAIVPAILYYLSLYVVVDSYARRYGLGPSETLPFRESLAGLQERWHLLLPLFCMVYLLMSQYSLMLTGAVCILVIIVVSWARVSTRMNLTAIYEAIVSGVRATVEVAIPSAVAGIIVGTLVQTGMALRLQRWLLDIAGGSLLLSLSGAMILTIILGMGMPTAAAYLVSAVLVAPALQELGVPALAAHLFIFYFAILSMVTPPVALAAYAAAGLSGANLWSSGLMAFILAIPGFLIPYAFVFDQAILLQGDLLHGSAIIAAAAIGIVALSAATGGYLLGPLTWPWRALLFVSAPLLIDPAFTTSIIGSGVVLLVVAYQFWRYRFATHAPTLVSAVETEAVRPSGSL